MHVARAFGRPDVDALLDEMTVEQLDEWLAYEELHPSGWRAVRIAAARVAWAIFQAVSRKPVDERKFLIRLASEGRVTNDASAARDRMEAFAIRSGIQERVRDERKAASNG